MAKRKAEEIVTTEISPSVKKSKQFEGENDITSVEIDEGELLCDDKEQVEYVYTINCPDDLEEQVVEDQNANEEFFTVVEQEESSEDDAEFKNSNIPIEFPENDDMQIDLEQIMKAEDEDEYSSVVELKIQQLEISSPLISIKDILISNGLINESCASVEYWLQDSEQLDPNKGLDQYCVESKGHVQVNLEVKTSSDGTKARINVTDILVPCDNLSRPNVGVVPRQRVIQPPKPRRPRLPKNNLAVQESSNIASWVVDQEFREIQQQMGMPAEIMSWDAEAVRTWLRWAGKHFPFQELDIDNCELTGADVCKWTNEDVQTLVPNDADNLFWTHLQLLIKCNIAALQVESNVQREDFELKAAPKQTTGRGNRSGNNGQIQLWQFLLEILIDQSHRDIIEWIGSDGTFRLKNPECVARLWGYKKNKDGMTYDKMSRAMRYYYEGDMIRKASGSRFTYKFVCDLRTMIGFTVAEIQNLVNSPTAAIESAEDTLNDQQRLFNLLETLKMPGCVRRGVPHGPHNFAYVTIEEPENLIPI